MLVDKNTNFSKSFWMVEFSEELRVFPVKSIISFPVLISSSIWFYISEMYETLSYFHKNEMPNEIYQIKCNFLDSIIFTSCYLAFTNIAISL
jgi:hypothetical protein